METVDYWIEFYSKIVGIDENSKKIFYGIIDLTISNCRKTLETVAKENIDSVREYIRWLKKLKDNIETAEEELVKLKQFKEKADKVQSRGFRNLFKKNKKEKPIERLKRLREQYVLHPR
jgi:uncharacterized protein Yka (UPF0111/DUF47 family)